MATIEDRTAALEKDFASFKAYLVAAGAVVAIFGVAGTWGFSILSTIKVELATAQENVKSLTDKVRVEKERLDAMSKLINPDQLEATVRAKIDQIAPETLNGLARQQLARAVAISSVSPTEGCLHLDQSKLQICWGVQELAPIDHTRKFNFTFARAFGSPPIVLPGINTQSNGHAPAVFEFSITEAQYSGAVNNMLTSGVPIPGKVFLNYVAIGTPTR